MGIQFDFDNFSINTGSSHVYNGTQLNLHPLIKLSKCALLPHSIDLFHICAIYVRRNKQPMTTCPFRHSMVVYNQFLSGSENNKPLISTLQFPSGHLLMLSGRGVEGFICSIALSCLSSLDVSPLFSSCGCVIGVESIFPDTCQIQTFCTEILRDLKDLNVWTFLKKTNSKSVDSMVL